MDQGKPPGGEGDAPETLQPGDYQELIDKAATGDKAALNELRETGAGRFEGKPVCDIPPALRPVYADPLRGAPISLDDLRSAREYDVRVVDDFVGKVCNPEWLPPGAAMMLFVYMCTKHKSAMSSFGGVLRRKLMQLFQLWDESHPWVQANILYRMRDRLHDEHHLTFCRAFAAKARQYDKIVEEERSAGKEVTEDGQREDHKEN